MPQFRLVRLPQMPINTRTCSCILLVLVAACILMKVWSKYRITISEHFGTFYPLPYAMHLDKDKYYPKDTNLLFADNKCCKSCCKNLWPLPFDVDDCETCDDNKEKDVLSNYTCQGENGSGCVCVTKPEADLLDRRGNNKITGMLDKTVENFSNF